MPVTLGIARGRIEIDTSDIAAARVVIEREAKIMGKSFDEAGAKGDKGAKTAADGWKKASQDLRGLAGDLAGISLAGAGLVAIGIKGADSLRLYSAQFKALLGDQTKADQVMQKLIKSANQFGVEQSEMLQLGRSLLPVLKGGSDELDAWVKRAVLLASTNPMKSTSEGVRAIAEFMAGQDMSLIRIFNVPPEVVQRAKAATKDVGEQLDLILKSLGANEQAAEAMGNTVGGAFTRLGNAAQTVFGQALRPIIDNFFVPALNFVGKFLTELNNFNPALLGLAGGFATVAAALAPVYFGLSKVLDGLRLVKQFGNTGVGKVAIGVGAVATGAEIGVGLVHKLGEGYGREDLKNYQLGDAFRTIIQLVGTAFLGLATIIVRVSQALTLFAFDVSKLPEKIANLIQGKGFKSNDDLMRETYNKPGGKSVGGQVSFLAGPTERERFMAESDKQYGELLAGIAKFVGTLGGGAPGAPSGEGGGSGSGTGSTTSPLGFSPEQLQAFQEHKDRQAEIDAQANEELEAEDTRHGERLLEIKQKSDKAIEKFDADEKQRHERAVAELERNIQDVRDNAKTREEQAAGEIADVKTKAQIAEIHALSEHLAQMADMQREHRENLLQAASRLDARAVFEEMKSFGLRKNKAEEGFKTQQDKERESVREHIQSINQRVAADSAADEARIAKMREQFGIEEGIRQDDAKARRGEIVQQGKDELIQENKNHDDRLAQIDKQHTKELKKENDHFIDRFNALGEHNGKMLNRYKEGLGDVERELNNWFLGVQGKLTAQAVQSGYTGPLVTSGPVTTTGNVGPKGTPYVRPLPEITYTPKNTALSSLPTKHIGAGYATGTNWAVGGRTVDEGEVVANRSVSDLIRSVIGNNFTQSDLASAFTRGGRGDINIPISISGVGQDARQIARQAAELVEARIIAELESMGR